MIKHSPNAITCCNLLSGCISIVLMCNGYAVAAGVMIFLAAIFDFFDGFAARLLKAYSPLGAQLDSLSDVVSFGVAPSFIMYHYLSQVVETSPLWRLEIWKLETCQMMRLFFFMDNQSVFRVKNMYKIFNLLSLTIDSDLLVLYL